MSPPAKSELRALTDRVVALLLTVSVGLGFVWAGWRWLALAPAVASQGASQIKANERLAYQHLETIIRAQRKYRQRDWDGDGRKTYARFHIHLWQSVRQDGGPVPVDLIPRELGFAMAPDFALDGYYYKGIHSRALMARLQNKPASAGAGVLDPAREWAVAAIPHKPQKTGLHSFVAHSSGAIWTQLRPLPGGSPLESKWVKITSADHLRILQTNTIYPK